MIKYVQCYGHIIMHIICIKVKPKTQNTNRIYPSIGIRE